ncbi:carbon-nitrogen hydrolase family protein [Paraburkholderia sediminicola]|uniref:carbon-nitrogen hydrolase family protein n=1 Tax=Paraburkholderia sediminicola TaxID=458836 RepID=UPI0038BAD987
MKSPRIRLIQSAVVDGDVAGNLDKALKTIAACADEVDLVVFSETFIPGFPTPENVSRLAEPMDGPSISAVRKAAKNAGLSVAIGFAEVDDGRFFNTGVLIDANGEILHRYRKSHLYASDEGVFEPGIEFPVCDWHGIRLGMLICFDIEFPETARMLAHHGAELIVVLDGMMKPYGHVHRAVIPVRAMENQLYMVMANRVGVGDQYTFSGESHVASPFGQTVSIAGSDDEAVVNVTLDMDDVRHAREEFRYVELSAIPLAGIPRH